MTHVVVMGVSGCGKSSLGAALAAQLGLPLIEGDDFHAPASQAKMAAGIALTDADRVDWLGSLANELARRPAGAVLTCSALKRQYRDRLRAAVPGLRFVHLLLPYEAALARVAARAPAHFFHPGLVANQFETLEPTAGESDVLDLAAEQPLPALAAQAGRWLQEARP